MTEELEKLEAQFRKEAKSWREAGAMMDGTSMAEMTPWQECCAHHAGVYLSCAHEVKKLTKRLKRSAK